MRSPVLPFLIGFVVLGALGQGAARQVDAAAAAAPRVQPQPLPRASLPGQLRASAGEPGAAPSQDAGLVPVPAYVPEQARDDLRVWSI